MSARPTIFGLGRGPYLAGTSIRDRLLADRRALLDLGTRNRLINIPLRTKNIRAIEIVDCKSAEVFDLLGQAKRCTFIPTEEDKPASTVHGSTETSAPSSKEIIGRSRSRQTETKLQTRLSSEGLQKRLLDIWYDAKTLEEEQGVNILYLAFGLLKWFEDDKSDTERFAPLVLLPVRLERSSAADRFHLVSRSEPPSPNLSLQAKMDGEFGLKIEDFGDEDDVDIAAYLSGIAETVSRKSRWEVRPDMMVLGFFSFSKFLMYRDLDPENWPADGSLDLHALIRGLLQDGFEASEPIVSDDGNIDAVIQPLAMNHVVDADSSQTVAIEEVARGRHLVIKGPPGTGKSQTITNIIASTAAQGQTVLFVAEKMAALDVVHRRLRDVGLGSLALELHSSKANKRILLEELKRTRSMSAPQPRGEATLVQRLTDIRDRLNEHAGMMHVAHEPSELTPFRLLGNLIRSWGSAGQSGHELEAPESWSPLELERRRELVQEIAERVASDGPPHLHPWRGVDRDALDPGEMEALRRSLDKLSDDLAKAVAGADRACALFDLSRPDTFGQATDLLGFVEAAAAMPECDRAAFRDPIWERPNEINEIVERGARFSKLKGVFESAFVESAWNGSVSECRDVIAKKGRSWLRILSPRYRAQTAVLASYLKVPMPKTVDQRLLLLDGLIAAQAARRSFEEVQTVGRSAFGGSWHKERSDWGKLESLSSWWDSFPKQVAGEGTRDRLASVLLSADVRKSLGDFRRVLDAAKSGVDQLVDFLRLDPGRVPVQIGPEMRFAEISAMLSEWRRSPERITRWVAFMDRIRTAEDDGLEMLVGRLLDGSLPGDRLLETFDRAYFEAMRSVIFAAHPKLKKFDGESHGRQVESFRKLDLERMKLARDQIAHEHASRLPRNIGGIGPLGVLNGEIAKKRNHLPIRQLLERGRTRYSAAQADLPHESAFGGSIPEARRGLVRFAGGRRGLPNRTRRRTRCGGAMPADGSRRRRTAATTHPLLREADGQRR